MNKQQPLFASSIACATLILTQFFIQSAFVQLSAQEKPTDEKQFLEKKFEYEIFKDIPGGHSFDRIDTKTAKEIRLKIYKFLANYLKPPHPFRSVDDLEKAGYR